MLFWVRKRWGKVGKKVGKGGYMVFMWFLCGFKVGSEVKECACVSVLVGFGAVEVFFWGEVVKKPQKV